MAPAVWESRRALLRSTTSYENPTSPIPLQEYKSAWIGQLKKVEGKIIKNLRNGHIKKSWHIGRAYEHHVLSFEGYSTNLRVPLKQDCHNLRELV